MKIALLIDTLGSGGAQRQIVNLACALTARGIKCHLIYYHDKNHYKQILDKHNVETILLEKKSRWDVSFILKLRKLILKEKYDILNTYLFVPGYVGLITKLMIFGNIRLVLSERSFEKNTPELFKKMRFFYSYVDLISSNSYAQTDVLKSLLPKLSHKIVYLPNSIDVEKFSRDIKNSIPKNHIKIIAIGRIEINKNPLLLIEAAVLLKNNHSIILDVIWAGSFQSKANNIEYLRECNQIIDDHELSNCWKWVGEIENVRELYENADIIYHGSFGEGFPNVVCEGLAMSSIIIASKVYDHPKILEEGVNGFLFDPLHVEELVNVILKIISLPDDEILKIRDVARLTAINMFSIDKISDLNINKYHKLLTN